MDFMSVTEEPHEVLLNEDTLDIILSFLDVKSKLKARMVCETWNDRILASFSKSLTFFLNLSQEEILRSFLPTAEKRIMTCISIRHLYTSKSKTLSSAFHHLLDSCGGFRQLSVLIISVRERDLDYLITSVNENSFERLKELQIYFCEILESEEPDNYKCSKLVAPDRLPALKVFGISSLYGDPDGHITASVQSFLPAAPNLDIIYSSILLNLSGLRVKRLYLFLTSMVSLKDEDIFGMIYSVRECLTHLEVDGIFPQSPLPTFPNLTFLDCREDEEESKVNLKALPKLTQLTLPSFGFPLEELPKHIWPSGRLQCINVDFEGVPRLLETFRVILTSGVPCLNLSTYSINIDEFVGWLEVVDLGMPVGRHVGSDVLKIRSLSEYRLERDVEVYFDSFVRILEELGERWKSVILTEFAFITEPTWKEKELSLFGGQKMGKARLSCCENMDNEPCHTVSLEIYK